jgi:prophage antirepressor-like protein
MNTNIQIFNNPQFGNIRIVMNEQGEPEFCLPDLCNVLGLSNPSVVKNRLDDGLSLSYPISDSLSRLQDTTFVTEPGYYDVVIRSDSPKAKPFRNWITGDVLPSIRKHGGYIAARRDETPEMIMARALKVADATLERHRLQLEQANSTILEQAPKVEYYDQCLESKGYLTVNMIAAGLGISHIKLNKLLCEWEIQYKQSGCYFLYSDYRDKGYTVHRPYPHPNSMGFTVTTQHMYWTEKGKKFIIELYHKK